MGVVKLQECLRLLSCSGIYKEGVMKVRSEEQKIITMTLDEDEARWLKDYLQNYLGKAKENFEEETKREKLFSSLKTILE